MATIEALETGVSFALTEEQRALRELAHDFAEKEIRPKAAEYDENQTHPADVIAKAHELGLMNTHIPEELGGLGLGGLEGVLIGEELAWGCSGIGTSIIANILGSLPVLLDGNDDQRREWITPLLEEPILCSFALTEPNAGSDVSGIQTTAVRHGDEYLINGSEMFITNAGRASWVIVFASTDRAAGHRAGEREHAQGRQRAEPLAEDRRPGGDRERVREQRRHPGGREHSAALEAELERDEGQSVASKEHRHEHKPRPAGHGSLRGDITRRVEDACGDPKPRRPRGGECCDHAGNGDPRRGGLP